MKYISYIIFKSFTMLFRILPFSIVYLFSDILCLVVRVVGYRSKLVTMNLRNSFPNKTIREIDAIKRGFYKHFCDMIVEEMKSHSMTVEETEKRYNVVNKEILDQYYEKGISVICLTGHYGNWEWATIGLHNQLKQKLAGFYKPVKNHLIDNAIRKQRSQCGMEICPIERTPYLFRQLKDKNAIIFMIADQSNPNYKKRIWVNFLHQETNCLQGPEHYSKMFDMPVLYIEARPIKRGYYECHVSHITESPLDTPEGFITKRYFEELEKSINRAPQYWMWSHKRWKFTRHETEKDKPIY